MKSPTTPPTHFDPCHLQPIASLNRRRFLLTPPDDSGLLNMTAHEVLSAYALAERVTEVPALSGPHGRAAHVRIRQLHAALALEDDVGRAAHQIVAQYGMRLGYFLASLHGENTLATGPDAWEAAYLAHWANEVQCVILGGGLAAGRMGEIIAHYAQFALAACGSAIQVEASPNAANLPLLGAARSIPARCSGRGPQTAVVADFGHTSAKSAVTYLGEQGDVTAVQPAPPRPIADLTGGDKTGALAAAMQEVLADRCRAAQQSGTFVPQIVCSLAAYLDAAQQPVKLERGAYTRFHALAQPMEVSTWLAAAISAAVGSTVQVSFLRDTGAAAAAYAGLRPAHSSAVVMLGTALAVGFVPAASGYRAMRGALL